MKKFNLQSYIKSHLHEAYHNQEEIDSILDRIGKYGVDKVARAELRRLQRLTQDDPQDIEDLELKNNERPLEDRIELVAPSSVGRYIPMSVVTNKMNEEGWDWYDVYQKDIDIVKMGPDEEDYWEAWDNIKRLLKITNKLGEPSELYEKDDLWLIPIDVEEGDLYDWFND